MRLLRDFSASLDMSIISRPIHQQEFCQAPPTCGEFGEGECVKLPQLVYPYCQLLVECCLGDDQQPVVTRTLDPFGIDGDEMLTLFDEVESSIPRTRKQVVVDIPDLFLPPAEDAIYGSVGTVFCVFCRYR